jgi:hypothetical protein
MSCATAYLFRDLDGRWRAFGAKYGSWQLLDPRVRDDVLAQLRERSSPRLHERSSLEPWLCRGVLLDMVERRLRVYGCATSSRQCENLERMLARSPAWAGWDVAYAWGRRDDFAELLPETAAVQIEPERFEQPSLDELSTALLEWEYLVGWDRERLCLRHHFAYWHSVGGLLSVIDERLDVLDYGFAYHPERVVLSWLQHGERLLDALAPLVPHPMPHENQVDQGVIVDCPARCIRYWGGEPIPSGLLAALRAAWPGWTIERLRYGLAGHLAATGRRDPDLLIPDAELSTDEIDPEWLRERAALVPDARGLRCIEEVVIPDWPPVPESSDTA